VPHLKCDACKARVRHASDATDLTACCPLCGSPLEAVAALSEIVGYRAVVPEPEQPASPDAVSRAGHERLAEKVAEIIAGRRSAQRALRSEVDRWAP
jgi:hypothetical protein